MGWYVLVSRHRQVGMLMQVGRGRQVDRHRDIFSTDIFSTDTFSTDTFSTGHIFDGTYYRRDTLSTMVPPSGLGGGNSMIGQVRSGYLCNLLFLAWLHLKRLIKIAVCQLSKICPLYILVENMYHFMYWSKICPSIICPSIICPSIICPSIICPSKICPSKKRPGARYHWCVTIEKH